MSGLAVTIDWERPIAPDATAHMLALVPHRAVAGARVAHFSTASLGEARMRAPDRWRIANYDGLAIVGDLRLWNRDGLRARAGGMGVTQGMDDRRLLIEAYRRSGIEFLDDVDGDYAFVIWDDRERRAIAVRDRFAMKPLFFERTATGIRFASEPKQLVATSDDPPRPNPRAIAEYVAWRFQDTRFSFFKNVERVRPSTALVVTREDDREIRYWNPSQDSVPTPPKKHIAAEFREQLVDSVKRRVDTSNGVVSQLSGGLDSTSVAAAAHILYDRNELSQPFLTASAVFPGFAIDESRWIDEIAGTQPFPHHSFRPDPPGIDIFDEDMWTEDQPQVDRIRDMWSETADFAVANDADLILAGSGGDEIVDYDQLLIDRLTRGSTTQRLSYARVAAFSSPRRVGGALARGLKDAVPTRIKEPIRNAIRRGSAGADALIHADLWESLESDPPLKAPYQFDFPTLTQITPAAAAVHPSVSWANELQSAQYASRGIDLSHPYFDRQLVEFVASLTPEAHPFQGDTKPLTRRAFAAHLPESILSRRTKTVADDYLDDIFVSQARQYRERYPEVSYPAQDFFDNRRYMTLLGHVDSGDIDFVTRESLWPAWAVMAWLDGLDRYKQRQTLPAIFDSIEDDEEAM